jgi:hypothetical protein
MISERALILAPRGRDAAIAAAMLAEADIQSTIARDIEALVAQLRSGAGLPSSRRRRCAAPICTDLTASSTLRRNGRISLSFC